MAKFDIYKNEFGNAPLVLEVQADLLEDLETVVVIPLVRTDKYTSTPFKRLTPVISIDGKKYILVTTDIATLHRKRLAEPIHSLSNDDEYTVINALDFLFSGF